MKASSTGRSTSSPATTGAVTVSVPRGAERSPAASDVGLFEIDQDAAAGGGVALAGFAQLERARRAMKQFSCRRDASRKAMARLTAAGDLPKAPAGAGEAALVDRRHKHFHRVDAVHLFFRTGEHWPSFHRLSSASPAR